MKSLTAYINEANSENTSLKKVEELGKHCDIDINGEVFVLTKLTKTKQLCLYKSTSKDELAEIYNNITSNPKEYGRYFTLVDSEDAAISMINKVVKTIPSFRGYGLEKKF